MESIGNALKISAALASEQAIVSRLMQLYQHDFSEFARADQSWGDVDDDALFSYICLDSYWTEDRRKPLLFRVNDKLAGFAFLSGWSHSGAAVDWCMSEFFVMRKYRRCGLAGMQPVRSSVAIRACGRFQSRRTIFWQRPFGRMSWLVWRTTTSKSLSAMASDGPAPSSG